MIGSPPGSNARSSGEVGFGARSEQRGGLGQRLAVDIGLEIERREARLRAADDVPASRGGRGERHRRLEPRFLVDEVTTGIEVVTGTEVRSGRRHRDVQLDDIESHRLVEPESFVDDVFVGQATEAEGK